MDLFLNHDEVDELRALLDAALADLSHEIADTDNWEYRQHLRARRERLATVRRQLTPRRPTARWNTPVEGADRR